MRSRNGGEMNAVRQTSGYMGKIVRIDLTTGSITHARTADYARNFLGGAGLATKVYWDEVPPQSSAFDPENRLVFATGPCGGLQGLAGSRWVVCGKSPASTPESFGHGNLGGSWGATLKLAGFDALIVQGQAERPVYILVHDDNVEIRDASGLWGKGAVQVREILKGELGSSVKVVAVGPAGDNKVALANLLADDDSSGSGDLGAVLGSKKLKAIAVAGTGKATCAQPERLQKLLEHVAQLKADNPRTGRLGRVDYPLIKENCCGCVEQCMRGYYQSKDGRRNKFMCQSSSLYIEWAQRYYGAPNQEVSVHATRLCDDYGLNTKAVASIIAWLDRCAQAGILTEKDTGLPLTKIGSVEFIEVLTSKIALRQGFGDILAQGVLRAAESLGSQAVQMLPDDVTKTGGQLNYGPKAYVTSSLLYAMELREPIQQLHEISFLAMEWTRWAEGGAGAKLTSDVFRAIAKRFWGSEIAADFSTYEGKALAAKKIQDRALAKDSLILCDFSWPITYVENSPTHVGDPSLESQILSAVTGKETTEDGLNRIGERIFNLQRAILVREGHHGRLHDTLPESCFTVPLETEFRNPQCLFPGKDGAVFSRKGAVIDRGGFQRMLTEYYELRGWDRETGLQRQAQLEGVGLQDVARDLGSRGLLGQTDTEVSK